MFKKVSVLAFGIVISSLAAPSVMRMPYVAGQFYPASAETLKNDIVGYLAKVNLPSDPLPPKILGMITPHAGYQYSGPTAAYDYKILQGLPVETIVIIGPYHRDNFPGVSIWTQGAWRTPLGDVLIDEDLATKIQNESGDFMYDSAIHKLEHSLETQVPFIQVVAQNAKRDAKIVPILISDVKYAKSLAKALHKHLAGRPALVLASTDLSHYHPEETAQKIDERTIKTFQTLSPDAFREAYQKGEIELCGAAAVLTLLELTQAQGGGEFVNLHYANSGAESRDFTNVVGYNASLTGQSDKFSAAQGDILLSIARDSLEAYLRNLDSPKFQIEDPVLTQKRAVFVTLRSKTGELRGCIGRFEAQEPLYQAVQHMAIEAATLDSRFSPLVQSEMQGLSIEISILDEPVIVKSANDIRFGAHGVILTQGGNSGVFLPDVAKEFKTKEDFLSELCSQKANLPQNCWLSPETQIKVFTVHSIERKKIF